MFGGLLGLLDAAENLIGWLANGGLVGNLVGWMVKVEGRRVGSSVGEKDGDSVAEEVGATAAVGPIVG